MDRIQDKINEIEDYLDELISIIPPSFEDYKKDIKTKAACERYFEKIVESVTDLAFLVIKDKLFKIPEEDGQAFDILAKNKTISYNLSEKMKNAKGMRNILAHKYGSVDDSLVFESISEELVNDVKEFIKFFEDLETKK